MKRPIRPFLRLAVAGAAVAIAALGLAPGLASACNVPVFRYALERWRPDPYRVTILHRGPFTVAQQKLVDRLDPSAGLPADATAANIALRTVDAAQAAGQSIVDSDADLRRLLAEFKPADAPRLIVQYPESLRITKPIFQAPLTEASVAQALASPLRAELVRRLAAGQTAVWLLLESGDKAKDDAAAELLTDELQAVSKTLELPELSDAPEDNLLSSAPLGINFSLLRIARGVPAELALVDALLASEPDLRDFKEPLVFPVFGRGRALLPLVGAGITKDNIVQSAEFLVGACSCEVKELNPGFDLLLAADWDKLLFSDPEAAAAAQLAAARTAAPKGPPELIAIPAGAAVATESRQPSSAKKPTSPPPASTAAATPAVRNSLDNKTPAPPREQLAATTLVWTGILALAVFFFTAAALRPRG